MNAVTFLLLALSRSVSAAQHSGKLSLRGTVEGDQCQTWSTNSCALDNTYCFVEEGTCMDEFRGTCKTKPRECPMSEDPVCGCNGQTYANGCNASANGVNVRHKGACEDGNACSPTTNPCRNKDLYFCDMAEGMCAEPPSAQNGACALYSPTAFACAASWEPVCGCDGRVYSNSCAARVNGINVLRNLDGEDVLPRSNCMEGEPNTVESKA